MIFRELEWQLAGRIKSVLIVFLTALLMFCAADTRDEYSGNNDRESYDNPIDRFFLGVEMDMSESMRKRWQILYLDAWESELAHAYELLEGELPENFFRENGYGQRAMQAFDTFSETQGYLEDYYVNDIFSSGGQESSLTMTSVRLELIRAQTLRIYGEIGDRGTMELRLRDDGQLERRMINAEDLYLFSESEAMHMMELISE